MRKIWKLCALLLALMLAFAWGVLAYRQQIFPYPQMLRGAEWLGLIEPEQRDQTDVRSRSPALGVLTTLPYVDGMTDRDLETRSVVLHDPSRASSGYNLYHAKNRREVHLLAMDGQSVHRWTYTPQQQTCPGLDIAEVHGELLPNGDLVLAEWCRRVVKIDRDSNVLWSYEANTHHDLAIAENGDVFAQTRRVRLVPEIHHEHEAFVDYLIVLSADGALKEEVSVLDILLQSPYRFVLPAVTHLEFAVEEQTLLFGQTVPGPAGKGALDVLHTNHVEVFGSDIASKTDLFRESDVLISMRNINAIAVIDWQTRQIRWFWGPSNLTFQHHPRLLENGNILIFDNGIEHSRIIELDPGAMKIVWQYAPAEGFFSDQQGSNQRLPNGNTLITDSVKGYAFEITSGGEVVWTFANPDFNSEGARRSLWRIERFEPAALSFLTLGRE